MNEPEDVLLGHRPGAFEPVGAAVAVLDADGTVAGWTGDARRLLGYSAAEMVGRPAAALLEAPDDDMSAALTAAERARAEGGWSGRVRVRHRDGHVLGLHLRVSPLAADDGEDGQEESAGALGAGWIVAAADRDQVGRSVWNAAASQSLLVRSPLVVIIWDPRLRYIWVNDATVEENRIPRERWLRRRIEDVLPGVLDTPPFEAVIRQVLDSGVPALGYEFSRRTPGDSPHRKHTYSISFYRLDGADGAPLGVIGLRADVTANRRARARLDLLSEASTRIGTTLDVMRTAQELADYAVPLLADFVTVDLAESVPLGEEPLARLDDRPGLTAVFRRGGVATVEQGPVALWGRGEAIYVAPSSPFVQVVRTGRSILQPVMDVAPGGWVDEDPERARVIRETGMHSLMITPIRARGEILGCAVFVRSRNPAPFEEDDLLLAEELVVRAALSLDNARRYARERTAALALQRNLLPHGLDGGSTLQVASRYLPADVADGVGGDWYDVIKLSGARTALVVGDVVGHGINAAASMGRLRTAVRTLADMDLPPDELLAALDRTVAHLDEEDSDSGGLPVAMGATCLYAVHDPITRRLTVARAGHPPLLLLRPGSGASVPYVPAGAPLGLGLLLFESAEFDLPPGCSIALYTDGLVETRDHDIDYGIERLAAALTPPEAALEDLCSGVFDAIETGTLSDDATLLMARPHFLDAADVASWELPDDPAGVAGARSLAARQLAVWGLPELTATTELIVGELVTNAVLHGAAPIHLRLIRHEVLVCEVSDSEPAQPRPRRATGEDESGRGLLLVARSCLRWGTRRTPGGKTVWAEVALAPGD
ncbi:SpoIIE family protein phosphatase [Streptomyces polygonati]|uniref:SpoIIE family protein phosphatase n=1 Tax=Streptomyces polygonati TaxID=1617087 RepID=A0ABV8HI14_9ACTN